jgi:hypothetical protein
MIEQLTNSEDSIIEKEYYKINSDEKEILIKLFKKYSNSDNVDDSILKTYKELKKYIYKNGIEPPTPEQFLNPEYGWLNRKEASDLRDWVKEDFCEILNNKKYYSQVVEYGCVRQGKCEAKDTPILMYDLSVKMIQDIKIGDILIGDDSKPRIVLSTHKGFGKLYKVKQNRADDYIVNENHILTLQYTNTVNKKNKLNKNSGEIIDISVKDFLNLKKYEQKNLKGIKAELHLSKQDVKIDPYFLGLWLGDGCKYHASITTMDSEIKDYIHSHADNLNLRVSETNNGSKATSYKICGNTVANQFIKNDNTLFYHLKDTYNLLHNKHIPKEYILNDRETRLKVLAGIIDTDGYLPKDKSGYWIVQKNEILANDIILLARTLGFRVLSSKKYNKKYDRYYTEIRIFGKITEIPVKIERKKAVNDSKVNPLRTGIKIEQVEDGEYFGFEVDGNHRYLHSDLTITHNSFLARLLMRYTIVFFHHLRDSQSYFGIGSDSSLKMFLLSFNYDKVKEVYLDPMFKAMSKSEKYIQVHRQDKVKEEQYKRGQDFIVYSKASLYGEITLASDLGIVTGNDDALSFIGSDLLQIYISELAFFIENAGASEENIFRLYTDSVQRINRTVGQTYLGFAYLDTSANDAESIIENHILKKLSQRKDVLFRQRSQWQIKELAKKSFPKWLKTKETFKICSGNGQFPAKFISNKLDEKDIPSELLIDIPIDVKADFEDNLLKSIKDIAGIPTSKESKFIQNTKLIELFFNNESLKNVESGIVADTSNQDKHWIWEIIKDTFFLNYDGINYILKRCPKEPRFLGIDLAYSSHGDVAGVSLLHKEWSRQKNSVVYVVDFSFPILPGQNGINLDSILQFIIDIKEKGRVHIVQSAIDTFQSEYFVQQLTNKNFNIIKHSTSRDLSSHNNFLKLLLGKIIKSGKNIFLKNNLNSLHRIKDKSNKSETVDHSKGNSSLTYNGNWNNSDCGKFHDDVYVSLIQALWCAMQNESLPITVYEDVNAKFGYEEIEIEEKPQIERKDFDNLIGNNGINNIQTTSINKSINETPIKNIKDLNENDDINYLLKNMIPKYYGKKNTTNNIVNNFKKRLF